MFEGPGGGEVMGVETTEAGGCWSKLGSDGESPSGELLGFDPNSGGLMPVGNGSCVPELGGGESNPEGGGPLSGNGGSSGSESPPIFFFLNRSKKPMVHPGY